MRTRRKSRLADFFRLTLVATRGKDRSVKRVFRELDNRPPPPPKTELEKQINREQQTLRQRLEGVEDEQDG